MIRNDTNLHENIRRLTAIAFRQNIVEMVCNKDYKKTQDSKVRDIDFWNDWDRHELTAAKHFPMENDMNCYREVFLEEIRNFYSDGVDRIILSDFHKCLIPLLAKKHKKWPQVINILEIGAGSGELACKLFKMFQRYQLNVHYTLVEPSELMEQAKENIKKKLISLNLDSKCVSYVKRNFENFSCEPNTFHAIISSGGPFFIDTVTLEQAKKNLKITEALLKINGIALFIGLTFALFSSKDTAMSPLSFCFSKSENFKNSPLPSVYFDCPTGKQRYLFQKRKSIQPQELEACQSKLSL